MQHPLHTTVARTSAALLGACSVAAMANTPAPQPMPPLEGHAQWAVLAMAESDCRDSLRNPTTPNGPVALNTGCLRQVGQALRSASAPDTPPNKRQAPRHQRPTADKHPVFSNWFQDFFR